MTEICVFCRKIEELDGPMRQHGKNVFQLPWGGVK